MKLLILLVLVISFGSSIFASSPMKQNGLCTKLDIVFVLDSSGSVNETNWNKVLKFIVDISDKLSIGPRDARIGVVVFGSKAKVGFHLGQHDTRESLQDAVKKLEFLDEATNTSGGIYTMMSMFSVDLGGRTSAPNIAVIVTDGVSTIDTEKTIPYAQEAKSKSILVMSVGVGNDTNKAELLGMAYNSSYVFSVNNFNTLKAIEDNVVLSVCDIPVPCRKNTDIAFILDASGSIGEKNFEKMKDFLKKVVDNLNVEKEFMSNIAMLTYSTKAEVLFHLHEHSSRYALKQEISKAHYTRGSTNTAEALRMVRQDIFREDRGDREMQEENKFANVAILLTDGSSNNFDETIKEAILTRQAGITLVVIALGNWLNLNELREVASDPDASYFYHVEFDSLQSITDSISHIVCDTEEDCHYNQCGQNGECVEHLAHYTCNCKEGYAGQNCQIGCNEVDLAIALDTSGSVRQDNFYKMLSYSKNIINSMNLNPVGGGRRSQVAMETFANRAKVQFHLDEYSTKADVIDQYSYAYKAGSTNTADALRTMRESMFSNQNGDRSDYPNVGLLITDGRSSDKKETFAQAASTRQQNIDLLAVGVKVRTNPYIQMELRGIANDPDAYNLFNVDTFSQLTNHTLSSVVNAICNNKDECKTNANHCKNGATCKDIMNGIECVCAEGFSGKYCDRHCSSKTDVVIAIDASGSIRQSRFYRVLEFLADVIDDLTIGEDKTRVGVLLFGDDAYLQFNLNQYKSKEDTMQALRMSTYRRGKTNIASALRMIREDIFTRSNGDRSDAPNFAILLTDGQATVEKANTLPEAIRSRIAGITLTVVALGTDKRTLELSGMASNPLDQHLYMIKNYTMLPTLLPKLVQATCDSENICENNPCGLNGACEDTHGGFRCNCNYGYTGVTCNRKCSSAVDVAFVLDASGSLEPSFSQAQVLARHVVQGLNYDSELTRTAVVTYSDQATVQFNLDQYSSKRTTLDAMSFLLERGRTNTVSALDALRYEIFTRDKGDRDGVRNVAIVVSDGNSNVDQEYTIEKAKRLRDRGVEIYAVGVGRQVDMSEVNGIADDGLSYIARDDSDIERISSLILDDMCQNQ